MATFPNAESATNEPPQGGIPIWAQNPDIKTYGEWPESDINTATHPLGRVAVFGPCFATKELLHKKLEQAVTTGRPEVFAELPGSHAAVLIEPNRMTVVSDPVGQAPLYYKELTDRTIVGSRPSLVSNEGLEPDVNYLAASLILPGAEGRVFGECSSFKGLRKLLGGQALHATVDGAHVNTYETLAPRANIDIHEAAKQLRQALDEAVASRVALGHPLSSDFSGGVDSTSIAFLAARHLSGESLPVFFFKRPGKVDGDEQYMRRYLGLNQNMRLHEFMDDDVVTSFSYDDFINTPRAEDLALAINVSPNGWKFFDTYNKYIAAKGTKIHMTGDGGDEVLGVNTTYLADLANPRHIVRFLREGMAWSRLRNSSPVHVWKSMAALSHQDPAESLRRTAAGLASGDNYEDWDRLGGIDMLRIVGTGVNWLTGQARQDLAAFLQDRAADLSLPEGFDIGDYFAINAMRSASQHANLLKYCAAIGDSGLSLHTPLLDRDVVRAVFALPASKRGSPYIFKPIAYEAFQGVVPAEVLERRSKGAYDEVVVGAIMRGRHVLHRIMNDSYLGDMGIIDPALVQRALGELDTKPMQSIWALERVLSVEGWLRSLESRSVTRPEASSRNTITVRSTQSVPAPDKQSNSSEFDTQTYAMPEYVHVVSSAAGNVVVFNRQTDKYYPLDATRSNMLRVLTTSSSITQAVAMLGAKYSRADPDVLNVDLKNCLQELLGLGLLHPSHNGVGRAVPKSAQSIRFTSTEDVVARGHTEGRSRLRERLLTVGAFAISQMLLRRAPEKRLTMLHSLQERWSRRDASQAEAQRLLQAAQSVPYLGRVACAEAPYAAALAAAFTRKTVEWHQGASFAPLSFHAWIEAEGVPVRTRYDGKVSGAFQSFFA